MSGSPLRVSDGPVVVIGAGPAGSAAAIAAARGGADVRLLDKADFPREKVCGCCLNRAGLRVIEQLGAGEVVARRGGVQRESLRLAAGGRSAHLPLRHGCAVSRGGLDLAMIDAARSLGVCFRPRTAARVVAPGRVRVGDEMLSASVVIVADGLRGGAMERDERVRPASHIGVGAIVDGGGAYAPRTIHMACGRGGYVGLVRVESGRLNIAAALDGRSIRAAGGPADAVAALLRDNGWPEVAGLGEARWTGTPALTRRRRSIAGERLLVVGDSAGYVEPFTGEGMAWALAGGAAAGAIAARAAADGWSAAFADQWRAAPRALVGRRQRGCRLVAAGLRRPWLTRLAVGVLRSRAGASVLERFGRRLYEPFALPPLPAGGVIA